MELSSLAALGKIAGLAGISLGVVVLLLRPVIHHALSLPTKQREPLLRLIAIGAFAIGALGIIAWWSGNSAPSSVSAGTCGMAAGGSASGNTITCASPPSKP